MLVHSNTSFVLSFYFSSSPFPWGVLCFVDAVLFRQAWEHAALRWQINSHCCNDFLVLLKLTTSIQRRIKFLLVHSLHSMLV